jgi:hypothetical protein
VLTLWDLLRPIKDAITGEGPAPKKIIEPEPRVDQGRARVGAPLTPGRVHHRVRKHPPPPGPAHEREVALGAEPRTMEERYDAVTRALLAKYDIRVRKWRSSMSGLAWYVTYRDGRVQRLIEAPRPRGPMSAAIFLHEIGHHAIGFNVYKPRCLEEYHAWQFSLREMEKNGLNITDAVRRRVRRSMQYAVAKARRRGIRELPAELHAYVQRAR